MKSQNTDNYQQRKFSWTANEFKSMFSPKIAPNNLQPMSQRKKSVKKNPPPDNKVS